MIKWYCNNCKEYPIIEEVYNTVVEKRRWNNKIKNYDLIDSSLDVPDEVRCGKCKQGLIIK